MSQYQIQQQIPDPQKGCLILIIAFLLGFLTHPIVIKLINLL